MKKFFYVAFLAIEANENGSGVYLRSYLEI